MHPKTPRSSALFHPSICVQESSNRESRGLGFQMHVRHYNEWSNNGKLLCRNLRCCFIWNCFEHSIWIKIYPLKTCQCVWILFSWAWPTVFAMELFYEDSWKTFWSSYRNFMWTNDTLKLKKQETCACLRNNGLWIRLLGAFSTYEQNFSNLTGLLIDSFMNFCCLRTIWLFCSSQKRCFTLKINI